MADLVINGSTYEGINIIQIRNTQGELEKFYLSENMTLDRPSGRFVSILVPQVPPVVATIGQASLVYLPETPQPAFVGIS